MLHAHVPRNLRVRASIQLAGTRVPARAFLIVAGLIVVGGLLIVAGADLVETAKATGLLIVLALAVVELRWWGRATPQAALLLLRHARRPRRLWLEPVVIVLPAEAAAPTTARRPRWQE